VVNGRLTHADGACLSWRNAGAASPVVQLGQQLISLRLDGLEMAGGRSDLLMLRPDKGDALINDDVLRQPLRLRVGEGGQETRQVLYTGTNGSTVQPDSQQPDRHIARQATAYSRVLLTVRASLKASRLDYSKMRWAARSSSVNTRTRFFLTRRALVVVPGPVGFFASVSGDSSSWPLDDMGVTGFALDGNGTGVAYLQTTLRRAFRGRAARNRRFCSWAT
jgi:hypothetical protein